MKKKLERRINNMDLVLCKNLEKSYGKKRVLEDVNLTIQSGKIYGLLGPNGSGKTTLIKLINQLLVPTKGEILIEGKKPGVDSKKVISYLPERTYLPNNQKIKEVLAYFKDFYADFQEERAHRLLEQLKIDSNTKLSELSKGTKEKVQLVLVMSRDADLYILDEPIGGVDPVARDFILDIILNNFREGASILLSTHLIADIERILDEVIFIKDGKIVLTGSAEKVREEHGKSIEDTFKEVFHNVL